YYSRKDNLETPSMAFNHRLNQSLEADPVVSIDREVETNASTLAPDQDDLEDPLPVTSFLSDEPMRKTITGAENLVRLDPQSRDTRRLRDEVFTDESGRMYLKPRIAVTGPRKSKSKYRR